jgi:predicted CXXCH cytochrome family protein
MKLASLLSYSYITSRASAFASAEKDCFRGHIRTILFVMASCLFLLTSPRRLCAAEDHSAYKSLDQCLQCHPQTLPTHTLGKPKSMSQNWPLDGSGSLLCITCHDCVTGTCVLRKPSPELCRVCHDCTRGMSCLIGVAHLGNSPEIETLAHKCLTCHDGRVATSIGGSKDHKIDIIYIPGRDYNYVSDKRIVFVNGKVTCISCHNPYASEEGRLVISDSGSRLCLTCHRM